MGIGREFIPEVEDMCIDAQGRRAYQEGEDVRGERDGFIPEEEDGGLEGAEEVARAGEEEVTCAGNAWQVGR